MAGYSSLFYSIGNSQSNRLSPRLGVVGRILGGLNGDLSRGTAGGLISLHCLLLSTASDEAGKEVLDGTGLLNLLLQVGAEAGIRHTRLVAGDVVGGETVEGLVVVRQIVDYVCAIVFCRCHVFVFVLVVTLLSVFIVAPNFGTGKENV